MYVAEKEGIYDGALMKALARGWRIWCCIWSLVARGGLLSIAQMVERQTVVVFLDICWSLVRFRLLRKIEVLLVF